MEPHQYVGVLILAATVVSFTCGTVSVVIAERKRCSSPFGFFLVGCLLGPIGILAAVLAAPGEPAPPVGMRAVMCTRCNARQNIARDQAEFECWQCKLVSQTPAAYRAR